MSTRGRRADSRSARSGAHTTPLNEPRRPLGATRALRRDCSRAWHRRRSRGDAPTLRSMVRLLVRNRTRTWFIRGTLGSVRSVIRVRVLFILLLAVVLVPGTALAHRRATRPERNAILAAVVRQGELSKAQAACQVVTISTVDRSYAALTWPASLSRACSRVAANGVILEHRKRGRWRFVTVGSSFRCPIKAVPNRVARDLGVCSY